MTFSATYTVKQCLALLSTKMPIWHPYLSEYLTH